MTGQLPAERTPPAYAVPQVATARFSAGRVEASAGVAVTPLGLIAIGGLVAAILLSVPPIIRAAGEARRSLRT